MSSSYITYFNDLHPAMYPMLGDASQPLFERMLGRKESVPMKNQTWTKGTGEQEQHVELRTMFENEMKRQFGSLDMYKEIMTSDTDIVEADKVL